MLTRRPSKTCTRGGCRTCRCSRTCAAADGAPVHSTPKRARHPTSQARCHSLRQVRPPAGWHVPLQVQRRPLRALELSPDEARADRRASTIARTVTLMPQAEHPRCASRSQAQWARHRRFDAQRKALSRQVRPVRRGQRVSGSADGSRCGVGAHAQTETRFAPLRRDCAASARPSRSGAAYSIACAPAGSAQPRRPPPSRNSTCRHGSPVRRTSTREYQPRDPTRGGCRGAVLEYCTGVV